MPNDVPKRNVPSPGRSQPHDREVPHGRVLNERTSPLRENVSVDWNSGRVVSERGGGGLPTSTGSAASEWPDLVRRLQPVLERMTSACVLLGVDSRVAALNSIATRLLGPGAERVVGHSPGEDLVPAKAWSDFEGIFSQAGAAGLSTSAVLEMRRHGELPAGAGARLTCEWRVTPLNRPDGSVAGHTAVLTVREGEVTGWATETGAGTARDVVFEHGPVPALVLGGDLEVAHANRAALELFRLTAERIQGKRFEDLLECCGERSGVEACAPTRVCDVCTVATLLRRSVVEETPVARWEIRKAQVRGASVENLSLRMTVSRMGSDVGAERGRVVVFLENVTELRRQERKLRDDAALMAASEDAICVADMAGHILSWNGGAERLYGWSGRDAAGMTITDAMFGGASYVWSGLRGLVLETGGWEGDLEPFNRKKEPLSVRARAWLTQADAGGEPGIALVSTDFTRRRQLEKQLLRAQRLESVGTLACGIAHDLNNVLTPVQMAAELLKPAVAGTDGERFLSLLVRSAARGVEITRQLLLFGRGNEEGHAPLDLRILVKETVKILGGTLPRSIHVRPELPDDLRPVIGDATQLHQVLLNLCVNARDAMPEGGTLTVLGRNEALDEAAARRFIGAKAGSYVRLSVRDTGIGIPREVLDRIFEPFFSTKPASAGTGLGLSTVQSIIRDHRGFVTVATEVGAGSEFSVYLPAAQTLPEGPVVSEPAPVRHGQDETLLLIEDDDSIREIVQSTLERSGYRVLVAADGAEGISVFGRHHAEISLVVMDMMLPLIDGSTAIRMFRRLEPETEIVAMSGIPSQRVVAETASEGRCRFLQKPLHHHLLLQAVSEGVAARARARAAGGSLSGWSADPKSPRSP